VLLYRLRALPQCFYNVLLNYLVVDCGSSSLWQQAITQAGRSSAAASKQVYVENG
jgi:hypothetical protein